MKFLHLILNTHYILFLTHSALCSRSNHSLQIVGGEDPDSDEFDYAVAIVTETGFNFCSGGILDDKHILTAAHCFLNKYYTYMTAEKYYVIAGTTDARKLGNGYTIAVAKVFIPNSYNRLTGDNDVAVLRLTKDLGISERPNLVAWELPIENKYPNMIRMWATVAAFGASKMDFSFDTINKCVKEIGILKYLHCILIKNDECIRALRRLNPDFELGDNDFCCNAWQSSDIDKPHVGMCYGDSGALLRWGKDYLGVAKRSPWNCDESKYPAVYTLIFPYLDFIKSAMTETHSAIMTTYYV